MLERMRPEHIPAVVAIEEQLFPNPWSQGMFEQEVSDNQLSRPRVATIEGAVVGYIVPWFVRDEAHLLNIAVDPAHQRRGIARAMLAELVAQCTTAGRRLISLEVRVSNHVARALYEEFGFRPVGIRKGYYEEDREDALVMVLDLQPAEGNA